VSVIIAFCYFLALHVGGESVCRQPFQVIEFVMEQFLSAFLPTKTLTITSAWAVLAGS
jgi:hypothetical protein